MAASRQARCGAARISGISRTSGGIGKIELSTNETTASAQAAFGRSARRIVQS